MGDHSDIDHTGLTKFVGVRIDEATAQSINNDTEDAMTSNDAEIFDTNGFHDTSSNTARLTPTIAGYYAITGDVFFAADADGYRQVKIRLNGSTQIGFTRVPAVGGGIATNIQAHVNAYLFNGTTDYVECTALHTAGAALNVTLRYFGMHLIGTA